MVSKAGNIWDLPCQRRLSYYALGTALALTLGTSQFIVPVKVAEFYDIVGADKDPYAKSLMTFILIPILILYNFLVSALPGPISLVYVVSVVYAVIYAFLAIEFWHAEKPDQWVAWVLYYATETKGVIVMPMLWSVVAEVSTPELSRKAYPFIFALTQAGGIVGSLVAIRVRSLGGPVFLMLLQSVLLLIVAVFNHLGFNALDCELSEKLLAEPVKPEHKKFNVIYDGLEGLYLLVSRGFAFGIFWVSYAALVPRTVLDYQSSMLIYGAFTNNDDRVGFYGRLTLCQNIASLLFNMFGTQAIVQYLGVGGSLLLLPFILMGCVTALCIDYTFCTSVSAGVVASVMAFGLNAPCKEMLFTRTSRDIKYKAKSWSEMWGNNFMKLLGAQINMWFNKPCLQPIPTVNITVVWVAIWIGVVVFVKRRFDNLEVEDKIVE